MCLLYLYPDQTTFRTKPKFDGEKDNSKLSAVNPALNQKCRALEYDQIWNARNLFASSIGHVVRQSPSTLTGKIIHVVREVSK